MRAAVRSVTQITDQDDYADGTSALADGDTLIWNAALQAFQPGTPAGGGTSDRNYVHEQAVPAATWTITHNMGKSPAVVTVDSGGSVILGAVTYLNPTQVRVVFSVAVGGYAYCN